MFKYFCRRLLLILPTLFGITFVYFIIINMAPGGPIERQISQLRFSGALGGGSGGALGGGAEQPHHITEEVVQILKEQYGLDKPLMTRYFIWLKNLARFDFGESFIYEEPVLDVILSKLPVSMQFGILSFLLTYLICIPLGIYKAVRDGSRWDGLSSIVLIIMYATPALVLGILLKTYLTGGLFLDLFPIGDLHSENYFEKNFFGKILDRTHHFVLPLICYMITSFTMLTFLMKNSLLECIRSDYVRTAQAKGLSQRIILWKHTLRNALIPIVTGMGGFLQIFFGGSLIVEKIFNLDGLGLLGFTSALERDFPVLLALMFIHSILDLIGRLICDLALTWVDPRISFGK